MNILISHTAALMRKRLLFCAAVVSQFAWGQPAPRPDLSHHDAERQLKAKQFLQRRMLAPQVVSDYGYDATFYHLQLQIFPMTQSIEGRLALEARSTKAGLTEIPVDFYDNMPILEVGDNAVAFTRVDNVVKLSLDRAYRAGEKLRVAIHYRGQPQDGGFGAFTFREHNGAPIIASLSEPYYARLWWPCKDTPGDKADSVEVELTVPSDLIAVSNGTLENIRQDGAWRTFSWKTRYPISSYLVSVAVTNYAEFSDSITFTDGTVMPIVNYVYPEDLADAQNELADTRDMLDFFSRTFGTYAFKKEKYGHAQFAWGGGMEHQTISSVGSFGNGLISHELAHQWWGDMISIKSWQDIWLNEGFASYSEALFVEHRDGKQAYHEYMNLMNRPYTSSVLVRDTSSVSKIFDRVVYHKGAWVLHMLRHEIGDSSFFTLLRRYAADPEFRYGNATTAAFQALAEQVAGQDLDWFFEQWVYWAGRPVLRYAWTYDSGAQQTVLRMLQRQEGDSYRLPMEVQALAGADTFRFALTHTGGCQEFRFPAATPVTALRVDQENWVYASFETVPFNNFSSDCSLVPDEFALLPVYPNPFTGAKQQATVHFSLSRSGEAKVEVLNILGQEIAALWQGLLPAGVHELQWDGRNAAGEQARAGIYFIRLRMEQAERIQKVVLLH